MSGNLAVTEGWLWEVRGMKLKRRLAPRYVILKGKYIFMFKEKPTTPEDPFRKLGILSMESRVEDLGRERLLTHALYTFRIYTPSSGASGLKLAVTTPSDQARWMEAFTRHIQEAGNITRAEDEVPPPFARDSHSLGRSFGSPRGSPRQQAAAGRPSVFKSWPEQELTAEAREALSCECAPDLQSDPTMDPEGNWKLHKCTDGLRLFKFQGEGTEKGAPILKAVVAVSASAEEVFTLLMDLSPVRKKWDKTFRSGVVVETVDGHTDVVHELLNPLFNSKPRDFCMVRYWRRKEGGKYEIFLTSMRHPGCPPSCDFNRGRIRSAAFVVTPLPSWGPSRARCLLEHVVEVDSAAWSGGFLGPLSKKHSKLRKLLLHRAGSIRELFAGVEPRTPTSRSRILGLPMMGLPFAGESGSEGRTPPVDDGTPAAVPGIPGELSLNEELWQRLFSAKDLEMTGGATSDEGYDDDDDFFDADDDCCVPHKPASPGSAPLEFALAAVSVEEPDSPVARDEDGRGCPKPSGLGEARIIPLGSSAKRGQKPQPPVRVPSAEDRPSELDFSHIAAGSFPLVELENGKDGWGEPPGSLFKVRGPTFMQDKGKMVALDPFFRTVAVDWFKSESRMDNVLGRPGHKVRESIERAWTGRGVEPFLWCVNLQIPGQTHYSAIAYYLCTQPLRNALVQRFLAEDDVFRNNRLKMLPRIHKGPWIMKQTVGNVACLLGKSLEITYHFGRNYMEMDVNVASSVVATGILRLALSYISTFAVDLGYLVQGETADEFPELLLGTVRLSRAELSSATPFPYA